MNGCELTRKLEDLTDEEIKNGKKAWDIAEEIFQTNYSNGEGNDVVMELLTNNFIYDYKDYKKTPYFLDCPEISNFCDQGWLIYQASGYIFWAEEMKLLLN